MSYAYYPGCSLLSGAKEYDLSVRAVFARLGVKLLELEDWSCCGAVLAGLEHRDAAVDLPARNLALAEAQGFDAIVAPCSGCYRNLRQASKAIAADKQVRQRVNDRLEGLPPLAGNVEVLHPLYVLLREVGVEALRARVTRPLNGLHVANYYGCMLTRPRDEFDSPERPRGLDQLVAALGAELVDYPLKAKCCGGALAISRSEVTARLAGNVLVSAKEAGADVVSLACPMCHTALDAYQGKAEQVLRQPIDLPVLYFTQLMGLALGMEPRELGLQRHLVPVGKALALIA